MKVCGLESRPRKARVRKSTQVLLNAACSKAPPVISAKAVLAEGGEAMTSSTTLVSEHQKSWAMI